MTQLEYACKGVITPEMLGVPIREDVSPELIRRVGRVRNPTSCLPKTESLSGLRTPLTKEYRR